MPKHRLLRLGTSTMNIQCPNIAKKIEELCMEKDVALRIIKIKTLIYNIIKELADNKSSDKGVDGEISREVSATAKTFRRVARKK